LAGPFPDVVGLYASEAKEIAEACGFLIEWKTTALDEHPIDSLRVIRQKRKSPNFIELVLSNQPIIWKGGGNGGI